MPTTDSEGPKTTQQQLQKNCKSHPLKTPLSLGSEWSIESLKLEKGASGVHSPAEVGERERMGGAEAAPVTLPGKLFSGALVNTPLWLHRSSSYPRVHALESSVGSPPYSLVPRLNTNVLWLFGPRTDSTVL